MKCDICGKQYAGSECFVKCNISWDKTTEGKYSRYNVCSNCYLRFYGEIGKAIHKIKYEMRHSMDNKSEDAT